MPEGDTVWRTAHRLNEVFAGHELARTELRWPGLSTLDLTGRRSVGVVARGKHLLHRVEGGWTIHSHLRMEGSWRIERTASPPAPLASPKIRAVLATGAYTAAGWSLGMLDVVPTGDEDALVGHLGPDVLGADWDAARAAANLGRSDATIAAALLDQRNLAGVGTMWASESLFLERLHPSAPAASLPEDRLIALAARAQRLIDRARRSPIPSSTGSTRRGEGTYVHGRNHRPCRRCGTPVEIAWEGPPTQRRTIYHCPKCQPPPP